MAKTLAKTTMSPSHFSMETDVLAEDLRTIQNALNWTAAERNTICHLNMHVGQPGWDDFALNNSGDPAGAQIGVGSINAYAGIFPASSQLLVDTDIWIDTDAVFGNIECGVECALGVGVQIAVEFAFTGGLGSSSVTVTCTNADNATEVTGSFDPGLVSNEGDEWIRLRIYAWQTTGAGAGEIKTFRVQELALTASILEADMDP